ncbi:hypothetical protein BCY76_013175, partial [Nesterenkonia sp. PF2B19]
RGGARRGRARRRTHRGDDASGADRTRHSGADAWLHLGTDGAQLVTRLGATAESSPEQAPAVLDALRRAHL